MADTAAAEPEAVVPIVVAERASVPAFHQEVVDALAVQLRSGAVAVPLRPEADNSAERVVDSAAALLVEERIVAEVDTVPARRASVPD